MTIQYQQLFQDRENSTSAVTVYNLPILTAKQVQLFIKVANVSTQTALCSVFHDNDGGVFDQTTALFYELKLVPGETLEIDHIFVRSTDERIGYQSSVANALTITGYGIIDLL